MASLGRCPSHLYLVHKERTRSHLPVGTFLARKECRTFARTHTCSGIGLEAQCSATCGLSRHCSRATHRCLWCTVGPNRRIVGSSSLSQPSVRPRRQCMNLEWSLLGIPRMGLSGPHHHRKLCHRTTRSCQSQLAHKTLLNIRNRSACSPPRNHILLLPRKKLDLWLYLGL